MLGGLWGVAVGLGRLPLFRTEAQVARLGSLEGPQGGPVRPLSVWEHGVSGMPPCVGAPWFQRPRCRRFFRVRGYRGQDRVLPRCFHDFCKGHCLRLFNWANLVVRRTCACAVDPSLALLVT